MNGIEIMNLISKGIIPPRIPFAPTIFEHAAKIMNVTPSKMANDIDLIVQGQLAAFEMYNHDIISVGVDIYNIEAEALGSSIIYYDDATVPAIEGTIVNNSSDLKNLSIPNPIKSGRMPIFMEACKIIKSRIGQEVPVSGTIVGPFTLSAILRGFENFLMDLMFDEEFALEQLEFASKVGFAYAKGFIDNGIGIAINESWITPPLLSPGLFKEKIFKIEKDLIRKMKEKGLNSVALISGGNTTSIADMLVKTGTSLLMADSNTDQKMYKKLCEQWKINLRASIASKIVEEGNIEEMEAAAKQVIDNCAENGRFIFGCGVVSYNTEPQNVLNLRGIVEKLNPYK